MISMWKRAKNQSNPDVNTTVCPYTLMFSQPARVVKFEEFSVFVRSFFQDSFFLESLFFFGGGEKPNFCGPSHVVDLWIFLRKRHEH